MKHRLPLSLISFLTTVLAIFATIFVPHLASADTPPTDSFTVVGQTADGQPIVEVNPGASINALVQRYAARYKATTGEDLTWQIIYAANPKQIIPNCINPPAGQPHWLGRGVESVWENCAEKDKTAGLVAGASAHITIPLAHVETYEERVARYTAADACLKDVDCLKGKLAGLGVIVTPTDNTELTSLQGQVKDLTAENDALKASLAKVPTPEPVATTDAPAKNGETPHASSRPPVSNPFWAFGLVALALTGGASYVAGKKIEARKQKKLASAIVPVTTASALTVHPYRVDEDEPEVMSELPESMRNIRTKAFVVPKEVAASAKTTEMKKVLATSVERSQEYRALKEAHDALTRERNGLVAKNKKLEEEVKDLKAENAVLRTQPAPQVVIHGGNNVVMTSAEPHDERETRPEIKPVVTPAPKPASFVPVAPTFGPPPAPADAGDRTSAPHLPALPLTPAELISHNEKELEALFAKLTKQVQQALDKEMNIEKARTIQVEADKVSRALDALRGPAKSIPPLETPTPVERISVPHEEGVSGSRITIPDHRPSPASPSLSSQEREIAELKKKLHDHDQAHRAFRRRMRTRIIEPLTKRASDAETRLAYATETHREQRVRRKRATQIYAGKFLRRIAQLTSDLEGAQAMNEAVDVIEYQRLQTEEPRLTGALHGKEWRLREIAADHTAAVAALRGLAEKRNDFKVVWSQIRELIDELAEAKASKRDTHTFVQLLDQQFASVEPLFQDLTGVGLTDVMIAPRNAEHEEPPPSERTIRRASLPPKVPHFDAEETYVPDGNDPPRSTRNGNGRVHTRDYPIVPADSRSSAPEIEVHENGTNGLPSPNDLANDIKNAQLLDAFTDDKLPAELVLNRRAVHCFKKLLMVPTRYSRELFTSQPTETADELCAQRQDLLTGMNQLEKMGIFAKKTLLPKSNLGSPFGDPRKNGA